MSEFYRLYLRIWVGQKSEHTKLLAFGAFFLWQLQKKKPWAYR